ncbi:MAG: phosphoribosylanthranilate isomerase [Chthonomonadales bacterium]
MSDSQTRIKICGITNSDDAKCTFDAGADYLGVIQVPSSPRYVFSKKTVSAIIEAAGDVPVVGVFASLADAMCCSYRTLFSYYQVYEIDTDMQPDRPLIYCIRAKDKSSVDGALVPSTTEYILLDTHAPDKFGGSGLVFDWSLFEYAKSKISLPGFLAGGLTPDNVKSAVDAVNPFAVDVSSGVERSPGIKDHAKVRDFIQAVQGR